MTRSRRRSLFLCATLSAGIALAGVRADPPPEVRAELLLSRTHALIHQQVVCSLRIHHPLWARPRWEAPPFEGFWSTRLSSIGEAMRTEGDGRKVRTTVFRRALFPTRTGELPIASSILSYTSEEGLERRVKVPGGSLRVNALPTSGRPASFADVVGGLEISAYLENTEVARGRSVGLTVDYYGDGNLQYAPAPQVEGVFGPAIEVFVERSTSVAGERNGLATSRRSFHYDLVAQELGRFILPPFELTYFDPDGGAYRTARSEKLTFQVMEARAVPERRPWQPRVETRLGPEVRWLLGAGGLLVLVGGLVGWAMLRGWRNAAQPVFGPPPPSPRALFDEACEGVGTGKFADLLSRALKAGVHARHHFDPLPYTTDELERRVDDPEAIALMRRLDQARFAGADKETDELVSAVRRYLDL